MASSGSNPAHISVLIVSYFFQEKFAATLCVSKCTARLRDLTKTDRTSDSVQLNQSVIELVTCDRCHRKFGSYDALLQHYRGKHSNITNLSAIENQVAAEKETEALYKTTIRSRGPSRVKLVAFVMIVVIAVSVVGYVAFSPKEQSSSKRVTVGMVAPDFSLPDVNGQTFTLSSYRGERNVLLFFSEGLACAPCLGQMKDLDQLNEKFVEHHVLVVSITGDSLNLLANWVRSSGPQYGLVLSDQSLSVSKMYDMLGADISMMPGTAPGHSFILVDMSGIVRWRADYGPNNMYVPNNEIIAQVIKAVGS